MKLVLLRTENRVFQNTPNYPQTWNVSLPVTRFGYWSASEKALVIPLKDGDRDL